MTTKPHPKEGVYFALRVLFTLLTLAVFAFNLSFFGDLASTSFAATFLVFAFYIVLIFVYVWLASVLMIGHLRGNGVEIGEQQFPEAHAMLLDAAAKLGLKKVPQVFLVQSGGVLNAYATRFVGRNYVAIYSDVFTTMSSQPEVLKFILSHELVHVARKHVQKRFWTVLSAWVPFLGSAYSRACEHTCDALAHEIVPDGSTKGLLLLAAGKDLYSRVNLEQYLASFRANNRGAVKIAGVLASHPHLPKRLGYLAGLARPTN